MLGRLTATMKKAGAATNTVTEAQGHSEGPRSDPKVTEEDLRVMAAIKRFPNENVAETRKAHMDYLQNKQEEFRKLVKRLNKQEEQLKGNEAGLVYGQWWTGQEKEKLRLEYKKLTREELSMVLYQSRKTPEEVEAERVSGVPTLQARIGQLAEEKRKVLTSLQEVEDEEIGHVDEEKQLKAQREDLTLRISETKAKQARVEVTLQQLLQVMREEESAHSVCKGQVAAPPTEHEGTARKRKAMDVGQEGLPKKAQISHDLEEEDPGEEEEAYPSEGAGRAKKADVTDKDDPAQKSAIVSRKRKANLIGPAREEQASNENEVVHKKVPAAAAASMQPSSSKQSAPRGDRPPPPAGVPVSIDELEQVVADMEFRKEYQGRLRFRFKCTLCEGCTEFCGNPADVCRHFAAHLCTEDKPYRCPWKGCQLTYVRATNLKTHFEKCHEQKWDEELKKESEVAPILHRLDALQRQIGGRGRLHAGGISFEELEEQDGITAITGDATRNRFQCSVCGEEVDGQRYKLRNHFRTHLHDDCLPFACPAKGCKNTSTRLQHLRDHFLTKHPKVKWTQEKEKECKVSANFQRLEAIVLGVLAAQPDDKRFTLDGLESRAKESTFTRNADNVLCMKCAACDELVKNPCRPGIGSHFVSHLRRNSLPFRCIVDGCGHMTGRAPDLRHHFGVKHPEQPWTTDMEKSCEVVENKIRLDAIVAMLCERRLSMAL